MQIQWGNWIFNDLWKSFIFFENLLLKIDPSEIKSFSTKNFSHLGVGMFPVFPLLPLISRRLQLKQSFNSYALIQHVHYPRSYTECPLPKLPLKDHRTWRTKFNWCPYKWDASRQETNARARRRRWRRMNHVKCLTLAISIHIHIQIND